MFIPCEISIVITLSRSCPILLVLKLPPLIFPKLTETPLLFFGAKNISASSGKAHHIQHVDIEGLATGCGIQGYIVDTMVALLKFHEVEPVINWVNYFIFLRCTLLPLHPNQPSHTFKFDLSTILQVTTPLGIPWHPISCKGHNFQSSFSYVGFRQDLVLHTVSLSTEKLQCLLSKVSSLLIVPT